MPTMLHETYLKMVKSRRIEAVMEKLTMAFPQVARVELRMLADQNCIFK